MAQVLLLPYLSIRGDTMYRPASRLRYGPRRVASMLRTHEIGALPREIGSLGLDDHHDGVHTIEWKMARKIDSSTYKTGLGRLCRLFPTIQSLARRCSK